MYPKNHSDAAIVLLKNTSILPPSGVTSHWWTSRWQVRLFLMRTSRFLVLCFVRWGAQADLHRESNIFARNSHNMGCWCSRPRDQVLPLKLGTRYHAPQYNVAQYLQEKSIWRWYMKWWSVVCWEHFVPRKSYSKGIHHKLYRSGAYPAGPNQ